MNIRAKLQPLAPLDWCTFIFKNILSLCILKTPKHALWQTVKTHFIWSAMFVKIKTTIRHDIQANPSVRYKTEGNPRARHDIGANPSIRLYLGANPCARHDIGATPYVRNYLGANPRARHDIGANPCVRYKTEGNPHARHDI